MHRMGAAAARRLVAALVATAILAGSSAGGVLAAGKPGYPDKLEWSGLTWSIKTSRSAVGPGPCRYDKSNATVVGGVLHLQVRPIAGSWTCAEIIGPVTHGYGTYTFVVDSDVSDLDPNLVLGMFTWSDRAPYAHREVDIEIARWGVPGDGFNAQHVVQPHDAAGHLTRFVQPAGTGTVHRFTWRQGSITWESRTADGALIADHAYAGSDVPRTGDERVRLNLWLFGGNAPVDGAPVDVAIRSFTFTPLSG